jgi:tetratricopeptide (TPR) repeat protein
MKLDQQCSRIFFHCILCLLFVALTGCQPKKAPVPAPDTRLTESLAEGDAQFEGRHLYAWRQAATAYQRAMELPGGNVVPSKLLQAKALIALRQTDEDIPGALPDSSLRTLCYAAGSPRERLLCGLVERESKRPAATRTILPSVTAASPDVRALDIWNSDYDAYVYWLVSKAYGFPLSSEDAEGLAIRYKDSPLFIYLDLSRWRVPATAELQQRFPQFAELHAFGGELLFSSRKYDGARTAFQMAMEAIPDYTRAINGLGNIYFFALEDYEGALQYYEKSRQWDPENTAALFGKGAVLHQLGRQAESNDVLDRMLSGDLTRRGRAEENTVKYYLGEAHYLQAYNHYQMKNAATARELVDKARSILPNSEEASSLSGLLFYEAGDMEAARRDFLTVTSRNEANCQALYYLGLIYHQRKDSLVDQRIAPSALPPSENSDKLLNALNQRFGIQESAGKIALNHFLGACSCMEKATRQLVSQVTAVAAMDLPPADKVALQGRKERRLADYRLSSSLLISGVVKILTDEDLPENQVYLKLMQEILQRLATPVR